MIPLFKVSMSDSVLEPLNKVLMSGFIGEGPKVIEFEKL
jgi:dTDP-4-amino-4,6-dideoxygalactose transaminase